MNPILVIGGTSFLGRHLLSRLDGRDAPVVATYHRSTDLPALRNVRWIRADLADPDPASAWPDRCESVVYLAQSRSWRSFPQDADGVFDVNVRGAFRAAEYARAAGARRFVLASTGSVYSGPGPSRETDVIDLSAPRQFYVAAKLSAELLLGACRPWLPVIALRLFVPYGLGQNPTMLLPRLVERVRVGDSILLDGSDGLRTNPVPAEDVAEAIDRCLDLDESATLNVAGPEVLSLREIATTIGEVLGREPRFERRDSGAQALIGDVTRLSEVLGWSPSTHFAAGLSRWLAPPSGRGDRG